MPTPKQSRTQDEPAYVLHQYPWSEASLILEVFSRHHGRLALMAKGVKRPSSQFRPVLLPLQPLRLGWGGDAEVRTLKNAQWQGGHVMPDGEALLAGYYLNELLLKLLARDDPHPRLFDCYALAVAQLAQPRQGSWPQAAILRAFELLLLRDVGFLPLLSEEGSSLALIDPGRSYRLVPEAGLLAQSGAASGPNLTGADWLILQQALDAPEAFAALLPVCGQLAQAGAPGNALRNQLRALLHYHGGVQGFRTRQLMLEVQRLMPPEPQPQPAPQS
jgi:DNA repair protein RecO (recombination protein O)